MTVAVISENTSGSTYTGVQDTILYEFDPTSPFYNNQTTVEVSSKTVGDRAHVVWDFTGLTNIPTGATVSAVDFEFTTTTAPGSQSVSIYGFNTSPVYGQMSWDNRATATAWTSGGALNSTDVNTTALETQACAAASVVHFTGASLLAFVQAKVTAGVSLKLLAARSNDTIYDSQGVVIVSSEGTDGSRPKLTVTYTVGSATIGAASIRQQNNRRTFGIRR